MSEPNRRENNRDNSGWVEAELARQFTPVKAPVSLWGRVEAARRSGARSPQAGWILWPAVAILLLVASSDLLWEIGRARGSMAPLTERDLEAVTAGAACEFRSADPAEIRRWVKVRTNIDVNLSCGRSTGARLVGASLIRKRGAVIAAIAYQVGNNAATLLVSDKHSIFRWNQEYAIAWSPSGQPGAKESGCNQCHVDARSQL